MKTAQEVQEALSDTFARKDFEAMMLLFAEDCVLREAPDLPFGGDWKGREGVAAFSAHQATMFDMEPTLLGVYHIDDSQFIMHTNMAMTSHATGETRVIPILEIFIVRDGLVAEVMPFYWNAGSLTPQAPVQA